MRPGCREGEAPLRDAAPATTSRVRRGGRPCLIGGWPRGIGSGSRRLRLFDTDGRGGVLLVLAVQVFIIMLGLGLAAPILPLYAQSFGVGAAAVGSLVTVFGLSRILINIPAGHWAERFGRRRLLILGPLATSVGSFGFALSSSFGALIGWRILQGFGSAVLTTAAMVVLADLSTPANRGRVMSLYQGSLLLGAGAGPALGGYIADLLGLRAPFLIFGSLTLLAALWAYLRLPETRGWIGGRPAEDGGATGGGRPEEGPAGDRAPGGGATEDRPAEGGATAGVAVTEGADAVAWAAPRASSNPSGAGPVDRGARAPESPRGFRSVLATLLRIPGFVLISVVTLSVFFSRSGGQMTLLPLFGHNVLGLSESTIGGVFTLIAAVNFATLYLAGALSDRFGRKAVIVPSGLLTALSIGLYALVGNSAAFVLNGLLLGIGTGLGGPAPAAYATDIAPPGAIGPAMGLYRTISDIGLVLGPVLLGWIVDASGFAPAFLVNAVLMAASTVAFALWAREPAPDTAHDDR